MTGTTDRRVAQVPPPMGDGEPYRLSLVCLGNICRSPMAEVVLQEALHRAGLHDLVHVDSYGTGDWHVGHPMDRRAAAALSEAGFDPSRHRARQFTQDRFGRHDLLLAMDDSNLANLHRLATHTELDADRVRRFRDFDPEAGPDDREVPDPYYGAEDGFDEVLAIVRRTTGELTGQLSALMLG